jgi:hypothetical protein
MSDRDHPSLLPATIFGSPVVGAAAGTLAKWSAANQGTLVEAEAVGIVFTGLGWFAGGVALIIFGDAFQKLVGVLGVIVGPITISLGLSWLYRPDAAKPWKRGQLCLMSSTCLPRRPRRPAGENLIGACRRPADSGTWQGAPVEEGGYSHTASL